MVQKRLSRSATWMLSGLGAVVLFTMEGCGSASSSAPSSPTVSNAVPSITSLSPSSATTGAAGQTLTINGTNFLSSSTVTYNSVSHTATFVNSTQLTISLSASDQATAGNFAVVVTNPPPGGGASNAFTFTVTTKSTPSRQTGSVTVLGPTACTAEGALSAASCTSISVSCPGIPTIDAILAITRPTGSSKGTIIFASGGAGTAFLSSGGADDYVGDGFQVVQLAWVTDWSETNGAGLTSAACRPATVFKYVFQTVQGSSRTTGFCGQGSSGGGAQLAYSLTQYGLGDYFDHLVIAAGPAVARLDYGCDPSLYTGPPRNLCPLLSDAPYVFTTHVQGFVNSWENTTNCGASNPSATDISRWAADSVVAPGANFSYPNTSISWFFCVTPSTLNESTGQGSFLIDAVNPKNAPPPVSCYSGICQGEGVWEDPNALTATESDMVAQCVPNH